MIPAASKASSSIGVVGADGSRERLPVAGDILDVDWTANGRPIFTKAITANRAGSWRGRPTATFGLPGRADSGRRLAVVDFGQPGRAGLPDIPPLRLR